VGTAEDLYHRPASPFVAQFVGRVNLLQGRVVDVAGDTARVSVLGGIVSAKAAPAGIAPGDAVMLVLRPEAIEVARDGRDSALRAKVVARTFLGEKIEYVLACGDATLQIVRYNAGPGDVFAEGATVGVRVVEEAVALLPGGAG
jgi:ABC-type Fe3+/spermidine/putrescine transport system ATPase subunit